MSRTITATELVAGDTFRVSEYSQPHTVLYREPELGRDAYTRDALVILTDTTNKRMSLVAQSFVTLIDRP